ncbi:uncharacterized protein NEMAJ01_0651 [Nematocida major]|uniref:uncharacterized protein n=1 Tax=Nematocida major TaxID=1912982 RepID=UPI0020086A88|nr:uncharacterized protein NEMAJ01_0651 [Nematocida major]KAH9385755.1 hypothetical protein NEMAJ01_0651 [Nematocida major]
MLISKAQILHDKVTARLRDALNDKITEMNVLSQIQAFFRKNPSMRKETEIFTCLQEILHKTGFLSGLGTGEICPDKGVLEELDSFLCDPCVFPLMSMSREISGSMQNIVSDSDSKMMQVFSKTFTTVFCKYFLNLTKVAWVLHRLKTAPESSMDSSRRACNTIKLAVFLRKQYETVGFALKIRLLQLLDVIYANGVSLGIGSGGNIQVFLRVLESMKKSTFYQFIAKVLPSAENTLLSGSGFPNKAKNSKILAWKNAAKRVLQAHSTWWFLEGLQLRNSKNSVIGASLLLYIESIPDIKGYVEEAKIASHIKQVKEFMYKIVLEMARDKYAENVPLGVLSESVVSSEFSELVKNQRESFTGKCLEWIHTGKHVETTRKKNTCRKRMLLAGAVLAGVLVLVGTAWGCTSCYAGCIKFE